jgi:hypothetical protein
MRNKKISLKSVLVLVWLGIKKIIGHTRNARVQKSQIENPAKVFLKSKIP